MLFRVGNILTKQREEATWDQLGISDVNLEFTNGHYKTPIRDLAETSKHAYRLRESWRRVYRLDKPLSKIVHLLLEDLSHSGILYDRFACRIQFHRLGKSRSPPPGRATLDTFQAQSTPERRGLLIKHNLVIRHTSTCWLNTYRTPKIGMKTMYSLWEVSHDFDVIEKPIDSNLTGEANQTCIPVLHDRVFDFIRSTNWDGLGDLSALRGLGYVAFQIAEQYPSPHQLEWVSLLTSTRNHEARVTLKVSRSEYLSWKQSSSVPGQRTGNDGVFIALGSNMGDRVQIIEVACRELARENIKVIRTSALYETQAMYVEDQSSFLNGVCEVSELRCLN